MTAEKITKENRFGEKMELVELRNSKHDPGKLHTWPLEPGETVEVSTRKGVRFGWRKYRPEGLK